MAAYNVDGISKNDITAAFKAYRELLVNCTATSARVSVGCHCDSLETIRRLYLETGVETCSYFASAEISWPKFKGCSDAGMLRSARLSARGVEIMFSPMLDMPLGYDWDESPPKYVSISVRWPPDPLTESTRLRVTDHMQEVLVQHSISGQAKYHETTSHRADGPHVISTLAVPREATTEVVDLIARPLGLDGAFASFEFEGAFGEISRLSTSGRYQPGINLSHLGALGAYGTRFAVEPRNHLMPVPNCTIDEAESIVMVANELQGDVTQLRIARDFLPWRLKDGAASRRTRGNACELILFKGEVAIRVSSSQFADSDPTATSVLGCAKAFVQDLGCKLKRSRY